MKKQSLFSKNSTHLKYAFIVSDEVKIRELIAVILEDLGFTPMQISASEWLEWRGDLKNPDLMVWDLGQEERLNPLQSFLSVRDQIVREKVKTLLLGGSESKADFKVDGAEIHFCSKPFSPTKLRFEISQLFGDKNNA